MTGLDPAFIATSHELGELPLCHARLQADARYAWIVLIPRGGAFREIGDLPPGEPERLIGEILRAGEAVRAVGEALGRPVEKLNVGALGNVTPQLHVHVVGRRADDVAWPDPVWGRGPAVAYEPAAQEKALAAARAVLGL